MAHTTGTSISFRVSTENATRKRHVVDGYSLLGLRAGNAGFERLTLYVAAIVLAFSDSRLRFPFAIGGERTPHVDHFREFAFFVPAHISAVVGADTGKILLLKSIVPPETEPRPEAIPQLGGQNRTDEGTHHGKAPPPMRGVAEELRRQIKADQDPKKKTKPKSHPELEPTSGRVGKPQRRIGSSSWVYHLTKQR